MSNNQPVEPSDLDPQSFAKPAVDAPWSDIPVAKTAPADVPKSRNRLKRWRNRVLAVVLGVVVGVAIAEILVRILQIEPPKLRSKVQLINRMADPPVYYHCYPDNRHGELSPLPDISKGDWVLQDYTFEHQSLSLKLLSETPWCVEYRHSTKGIRDRELSPQPAPGVTRLAVVGDSFVFGEGVPQDRTLPSQIAKLAGENVECFNGGQVGANTEQEVAMLRHIVQESGSARAILVFIPNDIKLSPALARRQEYINDLILIRDRYLQQHRRHSWYMGRLRVLDLAISPWQLRKIRTDTINWYLDSYDPSQNSAHLSELQGHFKVIKEQPHCRTVLVLYPLLEDFESGYPLASVHTRVARMAREAGLDVLDLAPTFAGRNTQSLWVHEADHHPNGTANEIAAQAIVEWLRNDVPGFLPEPSATAPQQ